MTIDPIDSPAAAVDQLLLEILGHTPRRGQTLRDQGMDSMASARLWLELRTRLGVELPLAWLATEADPERLATRIAEQRADGPPAATGWLEIVADPERRAEPFPLTAMQQSYVLGMHPDFTGDPVGCEQYLELEVRDLDVGRLTGAWRRLLARHDMLRSVVTADGMQRVVGDVPDVAIPVHDLRAVTRDAAVRELDDVRWRIVQRRDRDVERPAFAIEISLCEPVSVVHVSIDMRITDAHGLAVLLAQWRACYDEPGSVLPEPGLGARDCVVALCEQSRGTAHRADLAWWAARLRGLPPGPRVVAAQSGPRGAGRRTLEGALPAQEYRALRDQADAHEVSPSALILAVFARGLGARGRDDAFSLIVTTNLRAALPAGADTLVGPFTSAAIVVVGAAREPVERIARDLQHQLWDALQHTSASCVEVLRELRRQAPDGLIPTPPVVFTSLLGVGPGGRQDLGFGADVTFGACRTSEVALELQIWEQGDELRFRWDVAAGRFAPGDPDVLFAGFANALRGVAAGMTATYQPLNDLQQAYYVARASTPDAAWNGCQIYASFEAAVLDPRALEVTLAALVDRHAALRTHLTADGRLAVWTGAPARWTVPVIDLESAGDAAAIRDDMVGRAFALDTWPAFDVRLSRCAGSWRVHCAFDLAILDARSIHRLCRELSGARPRRASARASPPVIPAPATTWRDRLARLPPGPTLVAGDDRRRTRHEARIAGWHRLAAFAADHGVAPDMLLLAAFLDALAGTLCDRAFAVPVVRFPDDLDELRPGELTSLSWVEHIATGTLADKAAAYHRVIAGDPGASGLPELRRRILRERGSCEFTLSVVYTTIVDLGDAPLPSGIAQGPWLSCTPDVSLDCIALREGDELFVCWDAVAADFAPGVLAAMFASYRSAVEQLAHGAAAALPAPDREQILHGWNATAWPLPRDRLAHELFEHHAAHAPRAIALRGRGWTRSYGELNLAANRIARHLVTLGVGPETVVGVAIPRGPDMVAACLGILKAGGAYLPVEPALPAERAAQLLSQARAGIALTTSGALAWQVPAGTRLVEVDWLAGDAAAAANLSQRAAQDNLAYVIFTSGSTGVPKGVAVAHRAVVNLLQWCHRTFGFGPGDTGLCVTPLGFDLSVFDLLGVLGSGGSLYIADEVERQDPQVLLDVLLAERITFWNSAPAVLAHMAPLLPVVRGSPATAALRLVFLSGDHMPLALPGEMRAAFPGARIVNLGGATEATVWSNAFVVDEIDPSWRSIPYGRPIDNARYHVLDEHGEPCRPGAEGDLYIGGECLARGYHGRPDLTADRFVPDPFAREPGQRLYRTGDRAAYFPDGVLCFLGRRDRQLKIRGFRIELEEIEHRLRRHPGIRDAVVVARPDPSGDRKLVAYVIAAPGAVLDAPGLRTFAGQALPDYMVPNLVALVDAFPTTPNGKLDRDALPWPLPEPPAAAPADRPAQLADEIASLFGALLGVPRFDPAQDIWYQGATSFTVVQISQALYARHGRRVPVSAVITEPTAAGIARWLAAELAADRGAVAPPPAPPTAPPPVDYFSAEDQHAFRDRQWSLRPGVPGQRVIALPPPRIATEHYTWRSSRREFSPGPVPRDAFCRLLALLAQVVVGERNRRLYPSAGDTYAVQVYVAIRPGGVDELAPGIYYYHPVEHALHCVRPGGELDRTSHHATDRTTFDAAAFELHLIGQSHGIEPLYREQAERYLALEAGHISQLLMMGQAACGIGLCPIGELAFARVRELLGLDDGHRFLLAMLGGRAEWPAPSTAVAPVFAAPPSREVAIVGIAGRYPGADDPDALWQQLISGRSAIALPPPHRGLAATGSAGLLDRIDEFDSLLFGIAPAEAETLDPQLRLLLETVRACLDDAGHSPASLRRAAGRVGVVVAAMWQDYQQIGAEAWARGYEPVISASASDIAHRISQCLDFQGPSFAVDAACTSSVAAIHLAIDSLRRGECGAVIVGAVNLVLHPYHLGVLSGLGLSAPDLRGAFDAAASGWVPGEGVAAVLLRPAPAALADGDVIHGVIEATALGHSGGGAAVDSAALASSLARMLAEHQIAPSSVSYVECAAAGASVGDAAELEAVARVFGERAGTGPVLVGTLKPNIGHLEAAAGLSQLTKVVLQMRHGQIAPTRLAPRRNPLVAWDALPLQLVGEVTAWPRGSAPVRAVIDALGGGGAFGHLVVRAAPARQAPASAGGEPRREHVVVLSAASRPQLVALARRLRDRLAASPCELADLAYTLQTASADLPHRVAIPGSDLATVLRRLEAFVAGQPLDVPVTGPAAAWLRGDAVDWPWPRPARRVSLPAYPFAHRRHGPGTPGDSLEDLLLRLYAEVSGIARSELDPRVPLERYGLSSLLVRRLHARLERELGPVPPALLYEHGTLAEIAARLARRPATPQPATSPRAEPPAGDIAIIGIAGRYPGARDLWELWANLAAGRDCITPVPSERCLDGWPVERMWGGYLDGVDQFDAPLFNIAPRDADLMDPQERLFLEIVWEALDDAGYPRTRLRERHGSRVGVWVGSMYNEYPFFGVERSLGGEPVSAGAGPADIANRVSYFFDLRGPSMTVDTLCSSSLTSLHLAVESLRRGECEVAIAGGVNLSLHPNKFIEQARHALPSSDHRCRSFGARGDGFVPGEGAGAVVLKPLRAAIGDGDRIHVVIKATAINHGGRGNGYMVPSPAAQTEVVHGALAAAGVPASTIGYIEAHGTGTELGDPIEIAGLERAFAGCAPQLGHWPIGSVKSSIGHLEGAAGIAGLTKVVLQLRARAFAPSLHAEELNPAINWDRSPFRVQRTLAPWPAVRGAGGEPIPRRAGISSFGAGGANAHAIVEEYVALASGAGVAPGPQLIVLSALDEARLRVVARSLAAHLRAEQPALADVAYTLQVGREHLRERLAVAVSSTGELCDALERFGAGEDGGAIRGRATPGATVAASSDPAALGRAWVAGGTVDWAALHGTGRPNLVGLPSYPFDRRRHWVPWPAARAHANAPALRVYRKTWTAAEDRPGIPGSGRVVCTFHDGSEAVAHALAHRLGARVVLRRDTELGGAPSADAEWTGWIDLCDLYRCGRDPGPWRDRLALLQRLLRAWPATELRLLHVTSGLQDLDGAPPCLAGARVAGLVRMLRAEQRQVAATTLDIDAPPTDPSQAARQIVAELDASAPEVCHRAGRRLVPALQRIELAATELRLSRERTYVVTGGTRGLGALVARRLVERGARRLALLGAARPRAPGEDPALSLVRELEAAGAEVLLYRGPLDARSELDAFLARVRGRGDIGGIVHCAGSLPEERRPFSRGGSDRWGTVYGPKVDGLEVLGELCERDRPDFFVLFSSMAGWFPALAAGAAEYAAASAFLDWFAAHHARTGRPWWRSVAWPSWRGGGSAVPEPEAYHRLGLAGIDVEAGLRLFEAVAVAPSGGALLVDPGGTHSDPAKWLAVADEPSLAPPEAAAASQDREAPVPAWLTELFADSLGAAPSTLAPDVPFGELGVESILLAELVEKIETRVGRPLEPTLLLDHPTLAALAAALPSAGSAAPSSAPRAGAAPVAPHAADRRIAIIGASARFPGAPDLDTFWTELRDGRCAITEVPAGRWRADLLYRPQFEVGRTISKWGGFLAAIEDFDPRHFAMTDDEAICLDPAVRLMLEGVESCLADAGYTAADIAGRAVGVFAGARVSDYWRRTGSRTGSAGFGADQNFIAARIAHHLDLGGPCFVVDSACSSSLVAVQLAARSLLAGESELAFAAGVEVLLDERPYLEFSAARALSPSGRCRVFDERADGFVPGEGCGVVLLKRLDHALRDGDRIRAVIEAVAVNNDGRTVGLTTPNPAAQTAVILRALEQARRTASDIAMIEAHGTGTMLGDPIELRALTDAFASHALRPASCAIGSVKSNIGHLLSAAGIAGLLKAILSLERGEIPPTLFCERPNPRFEFARSPFYPIVGVQRWPDDRPRVAGVSAFGLGGTNAHLIVAAHDPASHAAAVRHPLAPPQLRRRRLWLDREPAIARPEIVPHTLIASILDLQFDGAS